jgi:hypothetical protein
MATSRDPSLHNFASPAWVLESRTEVENANRNPTSSILPYPFRIPMSTVHRTQTTAEILLKFGWPKHNNGCKNLNVCKCPRKTSHPSLTSVGLGLCPPPPNCALPASELLNLGLGSNLGARCRCCLGCHMRCLCTRLEDLTLASRGLALAFQSQASASDPARLRLSKLSVPGPLNMIFARTQISTSCSSRYCNPTTLLSLLSHRMVPNRLA